MNSSYFIGFAVWLFSYPFLGFTQSRYSFSVKSGLAISSQAYHNNRLQPTISAIHNLNSGFVQFQANYKVTKWIDVAMGMQLVEKGFVYDVKNVGLGTPTVFSTMYQYNLLYGELPLNAIFRLRKFSLAIGAIASYLIKANYDYKDRTLTTRPNKPPSIFDTQFFGEYPFDRFRKWDWGVNVGLSYRILKDFEIECNLQKHFIRVDKIAPQKGYADVMYNQSYLIGIRYYLF